MTSMSCQSLRRRSVMAPVVVVTVLVTSSKISHALRAMYCVSLRSRLMKSAGISLSLVSRRLYLVLLIAPCSYKLVMRFL